MWLQVETKKLEAFCLHLLPSKGKKSCVQATLYGKHYEVLEWRKIHRLAEVFSVWVSLTEFFWCMCVCVGFFFPCCFVLFCFVCVWLYGAGFFWERGLSVTCAGLWCRYLLNSRTNQSIENWKNFQPSCLLVTL